MWTKRLATRDGARAVFAAELRGTRVPPVFARPISAPTGKPAPIDVAQVPHSSTEQRRRSRPNSPVLSCPALREKREARAQQAAGRSHDVETPPRYRLTPLTSTREPGQAAYRRARAIASPLLDRQLAGATCTGPSSSLTHAPRPGNTPKTTRTPQRRPSTLAQTRSSTLWWTAYMASTTLLNNRRPRLSRYRRCRRLQLGTKPSQTARPPRSYRIRPRVDTLQITPIANPWVRT